MEYRLRGGKRIKPLTSIEGSDIRVFRLLEQGCDSTCSYDASGSLSMTFRAGDHRSTVTTGESLIALNLDTKKKEDLGIVDSINYTDMGYIIVVKNEIPRNRAKSVIPIKGV